MAQKEKQSFVRLSNQLLKPGLQTMFLTSKKTKKKKLVNKILLNKFSFTKQKKKLDNKQILFLFLNKNKNNKL